MVNLVKRDPFRGLFAWPRWDDLEEFSTSQRGLKIHETEKDIVVEAVVAGVPASDVEVHIEDGIVTIKAEKSQEENLSAGRQGKKEKSYRYSSYQYYYTAALSGGQWDKANAEIEDGVLELSIPKTKASRPRKVAVKARVKK